MATGPINGNSASPVVLRRKEKLQKDTVDFEGKMSDPVESFEVSCRVSPSNEDPNCKFVKEPRSNTTLTSLEETGYSLPDAKKRWNEIAVLHSHVANGYHVVFAEREHPDVVNFSKMIAGEIRQSKGFAGQFLDFLINFDVNNPADVQVPEAGIESKKNIPISDFLRTVFMLPQNSWEYKYVRFTLACLSGDILSAKKEIPNLSDGEILQITNRASKTKDIPVVQALSKALEAYDAYALAIRSNPLDEDDQFIHFSLRVFDFLITGNNGQDLFEGLKKLPNFAAGSGNPYQILIDTLKKYLNGPFYEGPAKNRLETVVKALENRIPSLMIEEIEDPTTSPPFETPMGFVTQVKIPGFPFRVPLQTATFQPNPNKTRNTAVFASGIGTGIAGGITAVGAGLNDSRSWTIGGAGAAGFGVGAAIATKVCENLDSIGFFGCVVGASVASSVLSSGIVAATLTTRPK